MLFRSDGLDAAAIRRLASDADFGLPSARPVDAVKSLRFWSDNRVPPPTPDIVAAELLYEVLNESPEKASEWLWTALADSAPMNVAGLGRIAFDIATLHGPDKLVCFANWLADSIAGLPSRAIRWKAIFEHETPIGVARLAVAIGRCLLEASEISEFDRASILNNLSQRLTDTGELVEALKCSEGATEILWNLAEKDPVQYESHLARSFTTLAMCLRPHKRSEEGAKAAQAAVAIWRKLAAEAGESYQPDLAKSLRICSDCLSEIGDYEESAKLSQEAVGIWRRLTKADPKQYEPELARTLNSLSVDLSQCDDQEGSIGAIREAVEIWQRLVDECAGSWEPELALALNNLSRNLTVQAEDAAGALSAIRRAIQIYGKVLSANPARYGIRLAQSLDNLHRDLRKTGDARASIQALRESVEIKKRLAAANSFQFEPGTIDKLDRLSLELSSANNEIDASAMITMLETAEQTVLVLLVRGQSPTGEDIFAYVAVRADRLEDFMAAQKADIFYPENFGVIVESGAGAPSPDVRTKMETEYGFNHQAMIDIPDIEKAYEIRHSLKTPPA